MRKYKISQFSKLMGVSLKSLKYYEKLKIVDPEIDQESNYRYYNFYDGGKMLRSKFFTNMGFSVKETSQIMNHKGNDEIIEALNWQENLNEKELQLLHLRQARIEEIKQKYLLFRDKANIGMIAYRKACYYITHVHEDAFIEDDKTVHRVQDLLNCQPHIIELSCYQKKDINEMPLERHLGLGIYADTAEILGLDVSEPMHFKKEEKCFLYIYSDIYKENFPKEIIKIALKHMEKEGYHFNGDIIVEGGLDQYPSGNRVVQRLVWIPIKE